MINSKRSESGYRYYNVTDCGDILHILYLRELGFSIKEITEDLNNSNANDIVKTIEEKIENTEKEICRMKRTKKALEDYNILCFAIANKPNTWEIADCNDYYYLKHTKISGFLNESSMSRYIKSWMDELIKLNLSMLIPRENLHSEDENDWFWGFSIQVETAQKLGILIDERVQRIHLGKCFIYIYSKESEEDNLNILDEPLEIISQLGYSVAGDVLCNYIFQTTNRNEEEKKVDNYIIIIPIC